MKLNANDEINQWLRTYLFQHPGCSLSEANQQLSNCRPDLLRRAGIDKSALAGFANSKSPSAQSKADLRSEIHREGKAVVEQTGWAYARAGEHVKTMNPRFANAMEPETFGRSSSSSSFGNASSKLDPQYKPDQKTKSREDFIENVHKRMARDKVPYSEAWEEESRVSVSLYNSMLGTSSDGRNIASATPVITGPGGPAEMRQSILDQNEKALEKKPLSDLLPYDVTDQEREVAIGARSKKPQDIMDALVNWVMKERGHTQPIAEAWANGRYRKLALLCNPPAPIKLAPGPTAYNPDASKS